jgi:hypothetical protein
MPSEREQPKRKKTGDPHDRPGEKPPSKVERDPNEIARFERPFERFEDLEDWQQPLRIDDDRESEESEDRRPAEGVSRVRRGNASPAPK